MRSGVNRCEIRDSRTGEEFPFEPFVTESSFTCIVERIELTRVLLRRAFGCEHEVRDRECLSPLIIYLLRAQFSYCCFALSTCYAFEASNYC